MVKGPAANRPWRLDLPLDPESRTPLYLQLVQAVIRDIRRGRLKPGDALPGARTLAGALGVTRKTVVTAMDELVTQGWLSTEPARGTFVAPAPPAHAVADADLRSRPPPEPPRPPGSAQGARGGAAARGRARGTLAFDDGAPDPRLAPVEALARAHRRALLELTRAGLGYGDPRGDIALRALLAAFLNQARGLSVDADQVLITRGSQMALFLAGRALLREPGDRIAVEDPGYRPAWEAFRLGGAELVPVAVDAEGLCVDQLADLPQRPPLRAVYATPHHQYPTTASLSPRRRARLLELAAARGFTVIEDDYDYEFHFDGRPLLPLSSSGDLGSVVYVGSLSKLLAPWVRVGYLVASRALVQRAAALREVVDRQGDPALERAIAELLEDGELQRHARKARRAYEERRDLLADLLRSALPGDLSFQVPAGGLALFCEARGVVDLERWRARAEERGLLFNPGRAHAFDGAPRPWLRLGYASLAPEELREAVARLARSRP
ncbi:PLP-dependent aminotransferase family protein [Polyangium aurulentum]|uniref:MocR-like pyridoxine biosynthesis transcription factor PdxR n=1 Tax=Polyangium aurulentum TaxID=2567896 RepID=UPI0010ADEB17|nr:PLP-dependent aminotransferase family protein [Polyangium aurulentum]UQA56911.1 PLP-dependent aminotransferase family protein [Polyangium aurulentum]